MLIKPHTFVSFALQIQHSDPETIHHTFVNLGESFVLLASVRVSSKPTFVLPNNSADRNPIATHLDPIVPTQAHPQRRSAQEPFATHFIVWIARW
jgi:hypothetical protein